jgi:hypothetical protein
MNKKAREPKYVRTCTCGQTFDSRVRMRQHIMFHQSMEGAKSHRDPQQIEQAMSKWMIYIPEEGHWPIQYDGDDAEMARRAYLRWASRSRLPAGSKIQKEQA